MRLKEKYLKKVVPEMMKKFEYKNTMAVPKVSKVVVNSSFGKTIATMTSNEQEKTKKLVLNDLAAITGQRPVLTEAKKSVSGFKLRQGMQIGAKVTLRKEKMYDFMERLVSVSLPRMRDFRGISRKCFDKSGNLTIGIKEHIIFPEISAEQAKSIFGLEITIITTTEDKEQGIELLKLLGFPIKNE